jgi:polyisoprenoid-binding protein YceI
MTRLLNTWLLAAFAAASAPAAAQTLVAAQSSIDFTSRQMGVPVDGRFKQFDAQVRFDPRKPETGRIAFTVHLASVSLGVAEVEAEVARPGWFDSQKFPQAWFESTALKAVGPGQYEVSGRLSLKGATRALVVPVTLTPNGSHTTASGSFVLKRLEFRIGDGEWSDTSLVANDVQVRFKLALAGLGPL